MRMDGQKQRAVLQHSFPFAITKNGLFIYWQLILARSSLLLSNLYHKKSQGVGFEVQLQTIFRFVLQELNTYFTSNEIKETHVC